MYISALVSLPVRVPLELCIRGEGGSGVAVCGDMLVISSSNTLQVFVVPNDDLGTLVHVGTLGRAA